MERQTDLLIIGAGPFGLAMAAYARHLAIDHLLIGEPVASWKKHMPAGMYLRSGCDWHIDPTDVHTIERFLEFQGLKPTDSVDKAVRSTRIARIARRHRRQRQDLITVHNGVHSAGW
jgi:cation diffusion facilitator CzcD-associated flavoprotein CzcO